MQKHVLARMLLACAGSRLKVIQVQCHGQCNVEPLEYSFNIYCV